MYPLDDASLAHAIQLMASIKEEDFESVDTYHTYIPDKNRYLEDQAIPRMDYETIGTSMKNASFDSTYLDLESRLTLEHYYRTDHHWRQEALPSVADHLLSEMEGTSLDASYDEKTYRPFHGVYHGQLALPIEGQTLRWLQNETLSESYRYDPVAEERAPIYEVDYLDDVDPYHLFLGGDRPITELHNPEAETDRHLVIFGDSFTNSLAPLLLEAYSDITFIDLRHMNPSGVSDYVTDDVDTLLFMYSTHILNDSWMLD
ncbi:MAG: DHHW family protein [Candidatus Izemoplasmataceae bacterium]